MTNEFARRIALTDIGRVRISTVLLGGGDYETCVFGGRYDNETERYGDLAGAQRGHNAWVGLVTRDRLPKQRLVQE